MIQFADHLSDEDVIALHGMLRETYWAGHRTLDAVRRSLENSTYVAARTEKEGLIGFARAVTDGVTISWICDVVVHRDFRGQGLGKQLVRRLLAHPKIEGTRKVLVTKDAQGLYHQFGFKTHPCECMLLSTEDSSMTFQPLAGGTSCTQRGV